MTIESLVMLIVIGAIAGLLADMVLGGSRIGFVSAIIVGVIGAFLGSWLFDQFNIRIPADPLLVNAVTAFVGSVILLLVLRTFRRA